MLNRRVRLGQVGWPVGDKEERSGRLVTTGERFTEAFFFALSEVDCVWYGATVITTPESAAFDRGVRPVLRIVLPDKTEAVLNYRADPELQRRIDDLAAKSTEGQLTEEERAEYEGYVRANKFVAILQRKARQMTGTKP